MNQSSDAGSSSARPTPIPLVVYRELRMGMVVIMAMLAAAVVIDWWSAAQQFQMALSEYFYTSAHSVFIAALLALSTLFFIYKGRSDTEDAFLTLAGICTFIAALVPQHPPRVVFAPNRLPEDYPEDAVILPNVGSVVLALGLGWALVMLQYRLMHSQQTRSPGGRLALYFLRLVVVVGLVALLAAWRVPWFQPLFIESVHGVAGTLLIFSFIATVLCAADVAGREEESRHAHRYRRIYRVIAVVMLLTLIGIVTLHLVLKDNWRLWILALESILILEFAAYWVVQSIELWDSPDPRERLPEHARPRPPEARTKLDLRGLKDEVVQARKDGRSWL